MDAKTKPDSATESNRREHQRVNIRIPVECRSASMAASRVVRTVTRNISSSGVYVELESPGYRLGDRIHVDLRIPPAEGVSPYQGQATCEAEVVRVANVVKKDEETPGRIGIAARFLDRLRFRY